MVVAEVPTGPVDNVMDWLMAGTELMVARQETWHRACAAAVVPVPEAEAPGLSLAEC